MAFEFFFKKNGITFSFTGSMSIDLLIFFKIVHLCSSKLRANSKGTQKMTYLKMTYFKRRDKVL